MGLFSFFNIRSSSNIQNPCPEDNDNRDNLTKLLDEWKKKTNQIAPMSLSAFFAAVNIVSNSIAMMDWLFKDKEGNPLPESNYLYHMFDSSSLRRFNIIKNLIQDIILYGNGFLYIERDKETGRPLTLYYSPARDTSIFYNALNYSVTYRNFRYSNNWDDGTNYLHFFMNSEDGFIGKGVLQYAYNMIDIASTIQEATQSYYSTTGQMFGIVTPNGELPMIGNKQKQINDLEASFKAARAKADKGTIFFPSDLKYIPMSSNAKDSSLIEAREYNAVEVGRFIANLSPVLLGDLRHNTYGTLSEAQKEFVIHSLAPFVKMIEDELNYKLIMPSKQGKQFIDLDEDSVLATDQEKQANIYNTYANSGIMTRNEIRDKLGLPPVDGGDTLILPYTDIEKNTINNDTNKSEGEDNE